MGRQFANDSMTPEAISVSRDSMENEIASDRPMHGENTPGNGSFNWDAGHYAKKMSYGTSVGGGSKATVTGVNPHAANRGSES